RDLKPANILVTAEGRPVLLDFGIAKLVAPEEGEGEQTQAGDRLHTPEYAAPEQLRGEPVTTATDGWGLGVLLYELLSGERPFRAPDSRAADTERRVLESEPRRMADVARSGEAAARRSAAPAALAAELRGDLEAIVQFARRKEPERRYRSAEQLGADVDRHLRGLPAQARPDTLRYRAAKYARRHRVGVAATAALALSLLAFAIVAAVQARRIAVERDRARAEQAKSARVLDVLVGLFQLSDPRSVPGGDTLRIGDALRVAEGRIEQVEDQPEVQARLWEALSSIHQSRSELPEQRQSLARGIAAAARAGDPDLALRLKRSLAVLTSRLEGARAAESLLAANLAESERRYGPRDERVAGALLERATAGPSGPERLALLERSLAIRRALSPAGSMEVASSLNALSGWWSGEGDDERALELLREAEGMLRASQPADHPDVMQVRHNMAVTLGRLGRFEESLRMHAELLPVRRRVLGPQTTAVAASLMGMGQMLRSSGVTALRPTCACCSCGCGGSSRRPRVMHAWARCAASSRA
ncbi:MAG: tetratricopeptide repeat protein, partial [Candidatus Eisenbacteria bacterium]|nr:tetratricopeptide repeat protein [Candidatus Eisenbacteria bacterium]